MATIKIHDSREIHVIPKLVLESCSEALADTVERLVVRRERELTCCYGWTLGELDERLERHETATGDVADELELVGNWYIEPATCKGHDLYVQRVIATFYRAELRSDLG